MRFIYSLKYAMLAVLFIPGYGAAAEDENCKDDVIKCFESYQKHVSNGSNNVSRYFAKDTNEVWLDSLISVSTLDGLLKRLRVTTNRSKFIGRICKIHDYSISYNGKETHLKFLYTNKDMKGPLLCTLFYKKELGYFRIDRVNYTTIIGDTEKLDKKYPVIRDFCKEKLKE